MIFAGSREFSVGAAQGRSPFSAVLHYPTRSQSHPTAFGPYALDVCMDAPLAPGRFPLVLISHGSGGSPLLYRHLSLLLARSGYLVALPRHPGNSLGDNDKADTEENLRNRPAQFIALLNALWSNPQLSGSIANEPVTAIGHSLGGYTALCVAGGQPWSTARQMIPVEHDSRVGALVLLAPACGPFLAPGALRAIHVPVLALTAEHDPLTPDAQIRAALRGIPDKAVVEIETVPNAGHFSFLAGFPSHMHDPDFAPAQDPSGFDRERFNQWLAGRVLEWIGQRRRERGALDSSGT